MIWNPYRNYDKGMDDAYMGKEPSDQNSQQYMEGYERSMQLLEEIDNNKKPEDGKDKARIKGVQ